jgi:hypothetical protein
MMKNGRTRTTAGRKVKARRVVLPWALDAYVDACLASGWDEDGNEVFASAVRALQEKNRNLVPCNFPAPL